MSASLRLALVQLATVDSDIEGNLARALQLIDRTPGARLYLLPELWSTGYAHHTWTRSADTDTPKVLEALQATAVRRSAFVGGTLISRGTGSLVNRFWLLGPDGSRAHYDKGHLFPPLGEDTHLAPGDARVRAPVDGWTAALSICFDLRFPEMYRLDALAGADLFLVPSAWPAERADTLRTLVRARAIENQAFLVLCNRTGTAADGLRFGGGSCVVSPEGSVQVEAGEEEGVVTAEITPACIAQVRDGGSLLDRRRSGLDW